MAQAVDLGLTEKCFILIGVGILPSARTANWMRNTVPGVHIPDAVINRLKGADKPQADPSCANWIKAYRVPQAEGEGGARGGRGGRRGRRRRG